MVKKVKNPETDRWIKIGGPTFNDLVKSGYSKEELMEGSVREVMSYQAPQTEEFKDSHVDDLLSLSTDYTDYESASAGWSDVAPGDKNERRRLLNRCGKGCFLKPDSLGFPICRKCKKNSCDCVQDCRGILAAKMRGRQWKYKNVADMADRLGREKGCDWSH